MVDQRAVDELFPAGAIRTCDREEETVELGRRLGRLLCGNRAILLLEGEMGTGKTVLVGGIAEGVGLVAEQVQSPTFTLINEYSDGAGARRLVHCDLYRLEPQQVESTGFYDLLETCACPVVVEWAERLPWKPIGAVRLRLSRPTGGEHRRVVERLQLETEEHG